MNVEDKCKILNELVQFAYQSGFHELGYDPVQELKDHIKGLEEDAGKWRKHKDSFNVLNAMLDAAAPTILNRLKAQDAVVDSQ